MKDIVKKHWLETLEAIARLNASEEKELADWTEEDAKEWGITPESIKSEHLKKWAELEKEAEIYQKLLAESGENANELYNEKSAYISIKVKEWRKKYRLCDETEV